jgi:preprotein translocase subunit SecE
MGMKFIMILMIVGFGFGLWGVDSIITKFENKNKNKKDGTIL